MIRTIVKKHALRDIILDFDDAIAAPDFEKRALELYDEAHDRTWALKQQAEAQVELLQQADARIMDLSMRRLAIEQDLDFMEEALGLKAQDETLILDTEITIDVNALYDAGISHNHDLQELYGLIDAVTATYNRDVDNIYEDDYLIDPMYFGILSELYRRYEELSVHTVSLDDDHQAFLGVYAEVEDLYFGYMYHAQAVFDKYAGLVEVSDQVYRRLERVQKHMDDRISGAQN